MKHLWLNLLSFCCLSLAAAPLNMLSPAPVVDGKPGDPAGRDRAAGASRAACDPQQGRRKVPFFREKSSRKRTRGGKVRLRF